jgi:hypothetical protein
MNEDIMFESFLGILNAKLSKDRLKVINSKRVAEMESAYKSLRAIVMEVNPDADIKCEMDEQNDCCGIITIETDDFMLENDSKFKEAIKKANKFEICPLISGKIIMVALFSGVTRESLAFGAC